MKISETLSDILKKHRPFYITGLIIILISPILDTLFPHLAFLMQFLSFTGICIIAYGLLLYMEEKGIKIAKILRITSHVLIACFIISLIIIESIIISNSKTTATDSDCIFVLGCGLRGDELTLMGKARADSAIDYLRANPNCKAILCGGQGNGETITEAEALYKYIEKAGIESERLFKEERSTDTKQNIVYAKQIVEINGLNPPTDKFAVVTNDFHLYRSVMISNKAGFENVEKINAPTPKLPFLRTCMYLREYFSLMLEFLNI